MQAIGSFRWQRFPVRSAVCRVSFYLIFGVKIFLPAEIIWDPSSQVVDENSGSPSLETQSPNNWTACFQSLRWSLGRGYSVPSKKE